MSKILIVDDSKTARAIVRRAFASYDVDIIEAKDGLEGLQVAKAESPDLIILDVSMPQLSGIKMLEKAKSDYALKNIPVIMLTVETDKDKVVQIAKLGIRDYMVKPFHEDLLIDKVARLIDLLPLAGKVKKRDLAERCEILIAENNPNIIKQIEKGLAHMPWGIHGVTTPEEVVEFCSSKVPDIILMNLSFKDNSALVAFEKLQEKAGCIGTPVYGLAIKASIGDQKEAQKAGFSGIITKPIDVPELEKKITKALNLDTSQRYFSWERDSLVIKLPVNTDEDVISDVASYYREKVFEAVDGGSRHVIVDISELDDLTVKIVKLLIKIQETCEELTVLFKIVGNDEVAAKAKDFEESQGWFFFHSMAEAFQA